MSSLLFHFWCLCLLSTISTIIFTGYRKSVYGQVVSDVINGIAPGKGITAMGHDFSILPSPEFAMPWDPATGQTAFQWVAICFSLMIGTAGLPHVIQRFYVVPRARDARWSVVWGLFFICILYWSAPVYSAFGKVLSANPEGW